MSAINRSAIKAGALVQVVQKQDQRTGRLTEGVVKDLLTKSPTHPHGIKVRLESGEVGSLGNPLNDSKGCGGVMRVAPVGLGWPGDPFLCGCEVAALTRRPLTFPETETSTSDERADEVAKVDL